MTVSIFALVMLDAVIVSVEFVLFAITDSGRNPSNG